MSPVVYLSSMPSQPSISNCLISVCRRWQAAQHPGGLDIQAPPRASGVSCVLVTFEDSLDLPIPAKSSPKTARHPFRSFPILDILAQAAQATAWR